MTTTENRTLFSAKTINGIDLLGMTTTENMQIVIAHHGLGIDLLEMAPTGNCNKILSCVCGVNYLFEMTTTENQTVGYLIK